MLSAEPAAGAPSDEITAVNAGTDVVSFAFPVVDGDVVRYLVGGGFSQIGGGLTANREYNVLVDMQNATIRLGSRFDPVGDVDPLRDVITFDAPHNFQNGDAVIYNPTGVSGLVKPGQSVVSGQTLYVRLIQVDGVVNGSPVYDAFKLRLTADPTQATKTDDQLLSTLTAGQIDSANDKLTMSSAGQFTSGQAVTYVAQGVKQFTGDFVDITVTTSDYEVFDSTGNQLDPRLIISAGTDVVRNLVYTSSNYLKVIHNGTAENIFIRGHGYSTGDAVIYRNLGTGPDIGGLTSGQQVPRDPRLGGRDPARRSGRRRLDRVHHRRSTTTQDPRGRTT